MFLLVLYVTKTVTCLLRSVLLPYFYLDVLFPSSLLYLACLILLLHYFNYSTSAEPYKSPDNSVSRYFQTLHLLLQINK